jgi:trk system potassium uptake protein TrkH
LVLTAASVGLILISGVSLWDAVNIALAGIATGGFSVHSEGIPFYNNTLLEILIVPVMIAGALPFKLYYLLYRGKGVRFFDDQQARLLFILVALGIFVIAWDLVTLSATDIPTAVRQALFMATAAVTSTGFRSPPERVGKRDGPLPLDADGDRRVVGEHRRRHQTLAGRPRSPEPGLVVPADVRLREGARALQVRRQGDPKNIADLEVSRNMLIIMLYFLTIFVATILAMHLQPTAFDSSNVIFEIVSAMCNNGISTGFVSPDMADTAKVLFIMIMWIGRLEIIPVIMLFMGVFKGFD